VVWTTVQEEGFGQAIYYARSTDRGESWSAPVQFGYRDPGDFETSFPYLASRGRSELHLIYLDDWHRGRFHRISTDGGETWSAPYRILSDMEGVNGYVTPVVDGSGQMHLIVNMRLAANQATGVYYARWWENSWSPVTPVDVSGRNIHHAAVTVRLGNELHVVYMDPGGGEIWHTQGRIPGVVQSSILPVPTVEILESTPTAVLSTVESTSAAERRPLGLPNSLPPPVSEVTPLLVGVAPALLLIVGVLAWVRGRPR